MSVLKILEIVSGLQKQPWVDAKVTPNPKFYQKGSFVEEL